jgi:hypothetical protein
MNRATKITSALAAPVVLFIACLLPTHADATQVRPQGPCDIYAAANTPCVAPSGLRAAVCQTFLFGRGALLLRTPEWLF